MAAETTNPHASPRHPKRPATSRQRRPLGHTQGLLEELESRMLLSLFLTAVRHTTATTTHSTKIATTNFKIDAAATAADALSGPTGLSPSIIKTAYGINQIEFGTTTGTGAGQTIAIVDAYNDPNITTDLHTFDVQYGLTDPTLSIINETGGTSLPSTDPSGRGDSWAVEISLDVEWAHAIAPNAKIVLVEATSDSDSDLLKAVNTARNYSGVSVVSMSWGDAETSANLSENATFTTPSGHTNVTFVASSGDNGAYGDGGRTKTVDYPAASPNVVAVGGTTLTVSSTGTYLSETAWGDGTSSGNDGGSGGGISTIEAQPSYQTGVVTQSTTKRTVPDVAFDADPNSGVSVVDSWDSPSSPWMVIGGTSLAAPVWAGIIAIADQGRVAAGKTTLTSAQTLQLLYSAPSTDFHDITTGNTGYAATTGYDLTTGLGTPVANLLVQYLAGNTTTTTTPTPTSVPSIASLSATPTSITAGTTLTLVASGVTDTLGSITAVSFYLETNGTTGLQTASDTLVGTGTQNGTTWSLSTSTTGLASGTYTYYAVATDSTGATSTPVSTSITVTTPVVTPTIGSFSITPGSVTVGTPVTLAATNVTESSGTISKVAFYLESNGTAGLQTSSDTLLGLGTKNSSTWTFITATAALAPGRYTYYAVATDAAGRTSAVASSALTVAAATTTSSTVTNDNFANATLLSGTSLTVTGSNVGATKESGEPFIAGNAGGKSVWYAWTAPSSGTVSLNTFGSNFDTLLGVFTGTSVSQLTAIAANDDAGRGTLDSAVVFRATAGTTYMIAVDGYRGAAGSITLNLAETVAPANDNFANATVLSGTSVTWTGTNVGATREPGEPFTAYNFGGASVWLAWTATTSVTMTLTTAGSNFDTLLGVYTGTSVSTLQTVAANDDASRQTLTSAVTFSAVAGTTYYFDVDGYNGATGNITLTLSPGGGGTSTSAPPGRFS